MISKKELLLDLILFEIVGNFIMINIIFTWNRFVSLTQKELVEDLIELI